MLARSPVVAFIPTTDFQKARAFFEGVLGLPFASEDGFAMTFDAVFPFHLKADLRNDAFVGAHLGPAVFDIFLNRSGNCVGSHVRSLAAKMRYTGEGQKLR